jgi:site-specific DNA-cytosine methylase
MTTGTHISLFSGVGMTDLAAELFGFETIALAEADDFNRSVLRRRFPATKVYADVCDVTATDPHLSRVARHRRDQRPLLVSGGFPCQDISLSGHGAGLDGARSGLWSEFARIIREFEPEYVLIENVAALRGRGLDRVLADLGGRGYQARWDCIPAAAVGAPHMRDRMFIVAMRADVSTLSGGPLGEPFGLVTTAGVRPGATAAETVNAPVLDKLPRAGRMVGGYVFELEPIATQREAKAALRDGEMLLPSPAKHEPGWRNLEILDRAGMPPAHPNQRFYDRATGRVVQKGVAQVATMFPNLKPASNVLIPTPSRRDGMSGPGRSPKRKGGPNLRTVVNEQEGDYKLNPEWVEWMMGLPAGWTDPDTANADLAPFEGWQDERLPRIDADAPHRRKRLEACGNGLVPQAAAVALAWMLS